MKQKDFESSRATDEAASEARIGPKKLRFWNQSNSEHDDQVNHIENSLRTRLNPKF